MKTSTPTLAALLFLATSAAFASSASAGLQSLPLGSAQVAPCDGIRGTLIDLGARDTEFLVDRPPMWLVLEVEGIRQDNSNGTVRFTQARAALTRYTSTGPLSSICLDARDGGAIVLDTTGSALVLTRRRGGDDVYTVRSQAQQVTITPAAGSGALFSHAILSPRDAMSIATTTSSFKMKASASRFTGPAGNLYVLRTNLPGGPDIARFQGATGHLGGNEWDLAPELGGNNWDLVPTPSGDAWHTASDSPWYARPRAVGGSVFIDLVETGVAIDIVETGIVMPVVRAPNLAQSAGTLSHVAIDIVATSLRYRGSWVE